MLEHVIVVIGPPAAGKTALTSQLGQRAGCSIFRLQEHLPEASPTPPNEVEPYESADDFTVIASTHTYIEAVIREGCADTLLLDGFPGTGTQVSLFLSLLGQLAPRCAVKTVELMADHEVLARRGDPLPGYKMRRHRYNELVEGTRRAFMAADIAMMRLDTSCSLEEAANKLAALIACGKGTANAS